MHHEPKEFTSGTLPSPGQVAALDSRRQWGLNFMVMAGQFGFFAVLLTLWMGQDLTYSPGWVHPMAYYDAFCLLACLVCAAWGAYLRRGHQGF